MYVLFNVWRSTKSAIKYNFVASTIYIQYAHISRCMYYIYIYTMPILVNNSRAIDWCFDSLIYLLCTSYLLPVSERDWLNSFDSIFTCLFCYALSYFLGQMNYSHKNRRPSSCSSLCSSTPPCLVGGWCAFLNAKLCKWSTNFLDFRLELKF